MIIIEMNTILALIKSEREKNIYEEILIEKLAEQIRYPLPTYLAYIASHN